MMTNLSLKNSTSLDYVFDGSSGNPFLSNISLICSSMFIWLAVSWRKNNAKALTIFLIFTGFYPILQYLFILLEGDKRYGSMM